MNAKSGIYSITNTVNGHRYIGSAANLRKRWTKHSGDLRRGAHGNRHLQNAWNRHGESVFRFEVLEDCAIHQLIKREQWWMDVVQPEYNIARVAGSSQGVVRTPETRVRIGLASKGRSVGRKHSAEELAKMSASQKGRIFTEETRAKMSAAAKGKIIGTETRARLRTANVGKKMSPEAIAKTAVAHRGQKRSPEACTRMSVAQQRRRQKEAERG